jgi:hypothetical protein
MNIALDSYLNKYYIVSHRNVSAEIFPNYKRGKIESLLGQMEVNPYFYEGLPACPNKDFHLINTMKERWKDVTGFEGMYKVSNFGRILSTGKGSNKSFRNQYTDKGNRLKKLFTDIDGYLNTNLYYKTKATHIRVHRLVMQEFVGKSDLEVNHIDGNKNNNRLDNLEYCTRLENENHAWKTGLKEINKTTRHTPVKQYDLDFNFIAKYHSQREAERQTGTRSADISACIKHRQHTANGFIWHKAKI